MERSGNITINSRQVNNIQAIISKNMNQQGTYDTNKYLMKKEMKNISNFQKGSQKLLGLSNAVNGNVGVTCNVIVSQKSITFQQLISQQQKKKLERPFKEKRFFQWFDRPKKPFVFRVSKEQKQLEKCKNVEELENIDCVVERKMFQQMKQKQGKLRITNSSSQKDRKRNLKGSPNQKKNVISFSPKHETAKGNLSDIQKLNVVENKRKQLLKELNSHKQNREKKTIFKTPMFLLDKTPIFLKSPKNAKKIVNLSSSIPKDFKTVQNICYPQDFGINQYIEQKNTKKTGFQFKKCMSSQKTIRSYSYLQKKDDIRFPRIFKTGKQISLQIVTNSNVKRFVYLKILKVLADNDASSTYLVLEKTTGFIYCLKKTEINSNNDQKNTKIENGSIQPQKQNIIRQSKIGMILEHSFLIKTYSTLFDDRNIYQLMQYAAGGSLHDHNKKQRNRNRNKNKIEEQQSLHSIQHIREILTQILQGVCYLHRKGITHRDLKPANIFLSNQHIFKIGDFGCSIYQIPKDYVGTLDYAAPQIMLHHQHSLPVDMWAIGCIAFQLFVGQPPFYQPTQQETIQKIVQCKFNITKVKNEQLKDFVTNLLNKDPNKRMSSLEALNHPFLKTGKILRNINV